MITDKVNHIAQRLRAIFGSGTFDRKYPAKELGYMITEYAEDCDKFSLAELDRALNYIKKSFNPSGKNYVPNIGEVIALCRKFRPEEIKNEQINAAKKSTKKCQTVYCELMGECEIPAFACKKDERGLWVCDSHYVAWLCAEPEKRRNQNNALHSF